MKPHLNKNSAIHLKVGQELLKRFIECIQLAKTLTDPHLVISFDVENRNLAVNEYLCILEGKQVDFKKAKKDILGLDE